MGGFLYTNKVEFPSPNWPSCPEEENENVKLLRQQR